MHSCVSARFYSISVLTSSSAFCTYVQGRAPAAFHACSLHRCMHVRISQAVFLSLSYPFAAIHSRLLPLPTKLILPVQLLPYSNTRERKGLSSSHRMRCNAYPHGHYLVRRPSVLPVQRHIYGGRCGWVRSKPPTAAYTANVDSTPPFSTTSVNRY